MSSKLVWIIVGGGFAVAAAGAVVIGIKMLHKKRIRQDQEMGLGPRAGDGWAGRAVQGM